MEKLNTKTTTIAIVILTIFAVTGVLTIPVLAQLPTDIVVGPRPSGVTDDMTVPTELMVMARPNPIGLNQELLINIWTVRAPGANRAFFDYEVTITKPSGQQEVFTMDSFVSDGTAWFPWIMNEVGDWTFQVEFPGMWFPAGTYVAGEYVGPEDTAGGFFGAGGSYYDEPVYAGPSTTPEVIVTVQQDYVPVWPESPLPDDYWTRPVTSENREWWPILGDFPWFGLGGGVKWDELYPDTNTFPARSGSNFDYSFVPWVQAPNTGHIVWKSMEEIGGLIGGDEGIPSDIFWDPAWNHKPTLILAGRCYEVVNRLEPDGPGQESVWQCYDIRTGEIYWERPFYPGEQEPNLIEYSPTTYTFGLETRGIHGVVPKLATPSLMRITGGRILKYDPVTGALYLNQTISPLTGSGGTYYRNGYCLAVQNLGGGNYRLINWTTLGSTNNFEDRVISNTSYAQSSLPSRIDWESGYGARISNVDRGGVRWGQRVRGYDLYTGEELWDITVEEPQFSGSATMADHGKVIIGSMKGYFVAYDLTNGQEVWKTETMDYPWDQTGWGSYGMCSAYGMIYWGAPSAYYAFNWEDGTTEWKARIPADFPFETVYGTGTTAEDSETVHPFHAPGWVADGKLFVYSLHHSPEPPYFRGQPMLAIDAFTGDVVWKLGGFTGCGQHTKSAVQFAMADGYLVLGARDGYKYAIGRGKSETTVTAPDVAVPSGTAMTIKGTVLDMSPAQTGTPCVSKDSMETQMQYLHLQMPIEGIHGNITITGVPVTLTAIHESGEVTDLGTVITNGYYGTFGKTWTPDTTGTYEIIASFEGDDSYGSSAAATSVTVGPAPQADVTPGPGEEPVHPMFSTEALIVIGVIAIASIAIIAYLLMRKPKK